MKATRLQKFEKREKRNDIIAKVLAGIIRALGAFIFLTFWVWVGVKLFDGLFMEGVCL